MDESGRDLGAYNYASMMHYSKSGFTTGGNTIDAPQHIGQRTHLTNGDAAGVQFLYSYCQSELDAPLCIASVADDVTHIIPYTATWNVDFNMNYLAETAAVSYEETTAPAGAVTYKYPAGTVLGNLTYTNVTFAPTIAEAGKTFVLGATFTGANGEATSCSVQVAVSDSEHVCFGIGSKNATVCSGRGRCVQSFPSLCECNEGYGGVDCSGLATCATNDFFGFDDREDVGPTILSDDLHVGIDVNVSAVGDGSLRVGTQGGASGEYMLYDPLTPSNPSKATLYMAAMENDNLPSFYLRYGSKQCVALHMYRTGEWVVGSERTGVRYERERFYFVDVRMDWASHTATVLTDGVVVARDAPMHPDCVGKPLTRVRFSGKGWIDEMSLWCTHYVLMSGSLVGDVDEAVVRDGGATLTLSLVGTSDTWVNTEETKRAIIKALVSDTPVPQGWNALIGQAVDESLVTITDKQVVVGPLRAAPTYKSAGDELVNVVLSSGMFTSGQVPDQEARELFFRVRGSCHSTAVYSFDREGEMRNATRISNITAAGAGALQLETALWATELPSGVAQPDAVRWSVRVEQADARAQVAIVSPSGEAVEVVYGGSEQDVLLHRAGRAGEWETVSAEDCGAAVVVGAYQQIEVAFDWDMRAYSVSLGGRLVAWGSLPEAMVAVSGVELQAEALPVYFDEVTFGCQDRPPVFSVQPCVVPGQVGGTMELHEGTHPLSVSDRVALVPARARSCRFAEFACRLLGACSSNTGMLSLHAGKLQWKMGPLARLRQEAEYKVCYYTAATGRYEMLESTMKTCARDPCPWRKCGRSSAHSRGKCGKGPRHWKH